MCQTSPLGLTSLTQTPPTQLSPGGQPIGVFEHEAAQKPALLHTSVVQASASLQSESNEQAGVVQDPPQQTPVLHTVSSATASFWQSGSC